MDEDKKSDPISEEGYFLEGHRADETPEMDSSMHRNDIRKGGRKVLFWGITLLLAGFALPLLLVFLIKSPQPDEYLLIFGSSYYNLLFIFFLSSAVLIHTSLFLLRAKPLVVIVFFVLSVFCCLPFIVGLKKNLTLNEVILGIPFFSDWPFFLNPAYVLIEFLIPLGVVIYLFLQMKNIFSEKTRNYAFLCVAIFLSVAAILGLFGLNEAKLPNIGVALAQVKDYFSNRLPDTRFGEKTFRNPVSEVDDNSEIEKRVKLPILPFVKDADDLKRGEDVADASTNVEQLAEKVDRLEEQLREMKELFSVRQAARQERKAVALTQETETINSPEERSEIAEVQEKMRLLSEDVRAISNALKQMTLLLPAPTERPDKRVETEGREEKDTDIEEMYP